MFIQRFLIVVVVFFLTLTLSTETIFASESDGPASNFSLSTSDDQVIRLTDFKGKKVVLTFWTSWCTYCQEELAELTKFYKEKQEDIEVIGVNITSSEQSKEGVIQFIRQQNFPFQIGLDVDGTVSKNYHIIGIPTTFILDENTKIKEKLLGPVTGKTLHQALLKIESN